ncbi:MAG: hypothetical protein EPN56_09395 [Rhodanobacter sp.]|nr:MAG: hypothetical protein EPN78_05260 [Rhodanobacter sp.]TAM13480.1 MAG: hypothetical protein EPN66_04190 [Rhodanobacter sp.]TAM35767.1 MAG: hypothetical protein EPN56_09395 [Rhodanobacter sp.]
MLNRTRIVPLCLALGAGLLLGGCHAAKVLVPPNLRAADTTTDDPLKLAQTRLADATPCCTNFADFSYQNPLPWQPQKFTVGPGSSVANISGTHTYFLAFKLPENAKLPYRIAFKAELSGRWVKTSYLFAPTVVLLDSGFQPTGASDDIKLCERMGWSDETSGAFGAYTVNSADARYMLIYSSADQQSGKTYWEQSPAAFNSKATLAMNNTGSFSVQHGPDGTLWVGMMNDTYAKAVDDSICGKHEKGDGVLNTLRSAVPLPWSGDHSATPDKNAGNKGG